MSNIGVYAAAAAILASLIAGFFSLINLISSKETKVSEFRITWIDGLRSELAEYISALHELIRIETYSQNIEESSDIDEREKRETVFKLIELSLGPAKVARESLWKIKSRLNPNHVKDRPEGLEARLMEVVKDAAAKFNDGKYSDALLLLGKFEEIAPMLLKREWEKVKQGEPTYRYIRLGGLVIVIIGFAITTMVSIWAVYSMHSGSHEKDVAPNQIHLNQNTDAISMHALGVNSACPQYVITNPMPGINIDVNVNDRHTYSAQKKAPPGAVLKKESDCHPLSTVRQ